MGFRLARSQSFRRAVLKVKMILNSYPRIKKFVSTVRFCLWKVQVYFRSRKIHPAFDPNRTCWANPADIEYIFENPETTVVARKYANRGKVSAGDWDKLDKRFEDTDLYKGFYAHFVESVPWQQTELYKRVMSELQAGKVLYGCNSKEDYDLKCEKLDQIHHHIKEHGYTAQKDIAESEADPYKGEDEISVCVGRDGDLLFEDGRHRLAIAKVLGLEKIPIKITMVHSQWQNFRNEIIDYAQRHNGKIYQHIWHSDLSSVPFVHSEQRYEIIRDNLPCKAGRLLDIGAHWGYWSQRFEEFGFECHTIESSVKNVYFMKKLRRAENKHYKIYNCNVFDYDGPVKFDIVLGLNIFHHFLKDKGSYDKLVELLGRLETDYMFFEPHVKGEETMVGSYRDFDNEEFVKFIIENSCLNSSRHLGQADDGRQLYLLQR